MKKVGDTPELLENFSGRDQEFFQPIFIFEILEYNKQMRR